MHMHNEVAYNGKVEGDVLSPVRMPLLIGSETLGLAYAYGLSLLCIELMASAASRYDISRLGWKL